MSLETSDPRVAGFNEQRLTVLRDAIRREIDAGRMPGAVVGIARRGKLAMLEAFGARDPSSGAAMQVDSVFSIASMTKPMTSVAIMQLFEEGKLLLGDPVGAYLPEMSAFELGVSEGDQLRRVKPTRQPTIQDLLRHTSGLTYQGRGTTPVHAAYPGSSVSAAMALTKAETIERLAGCPLLFEPGTVWEYGFSTDVLGFVVEEVAGRPLGAQLLEKVWSPLGMQETAFDLDEATRPRHALPFAHDPLTGAPQDVYHQRQGTKHWESGGGGAVSTAADYLRFAEMLRRGGRIDDTRVLGPQTVRLMTSDHLEATAANRIADTMDPAAEGYGFGLGFAVRRQDGISALAGTRGDYYWSGVFGTYFWIDPAMELSCVIMAAMPGVLRLRMRQLSRALVYQAIEG